MQIRPLTQADIQRAAALHGRSIPYSLNAMMGVSHLAFLYRLMLASDVAVTFVAVDSQGLVVGVVTGVVCCRRFLRSVPVLRVVAQYASQTIKHPKVVLYGVRALMGRMPLRPRGVTAKLTTIAVDSSARCSGIGGALVRTLEAEFCRRGVREYMLDTLKKNIVARKFYGKLGFRETSEGTHDVCFVKELESQVSP